jgi:hypothetical protein
VDRASDRAVWIVVGALVGAVGAALWRRLDALVVVAGEEAEAPTRVAPKPTDPARAAASRKVMKEAGWHDRYRCEVCGLESTKGGIGKHHAASGHAGRIKV